ESHGVLEELPVRRFASRRRPAVFLLYGPAAGPLELYAERQRQNGGLQGEQGRAAPVRPDGLEPGGDRTDPAVAASDARNAASEREKRPQVLVVLPLPGRGLHSGTGRADSEIRAAAGPPDLCADGDCFFDAGGERNRELFERPLDRRR